MTFLELHKMLKQICKARKGNPNKTDVFKECELKPDEEEFFLLVYDRALATADEIVNHYLKKCELDKNEKIIVTFEKGE